MTFASAQLIAPRPADRVLWTLALGGLAPRLHHWLPTSTVPHIAPDLWVVVPDVRAGLEACRVWLPQLSAPTLLICDSPSLAQRLSKYIVPPLLISGSAAAQQHLAAQLTLLGELTAGRVWYGASDTVTGLHRFVPQQGGRDARS